MGCKEEGPTWALISWHGPVGDDVCLAALLWRTTKTSPYLFSYPLCLQIFSPFIIIHHQILPSLTYILLLSILPP